MLRQPDRAKLRCSRTQKVHLKSSLDLPGSMKEKLRGGKLQNANGYSLIGQKENDLLQ
jgi:hypothetical protein